MLPEKETIVLIGPPCVGKTSLCDAVAKKINKNAISLDVVGPVYYQEFGFTKSDFSYTENSAGYVEAYKLWEPARVYAVKKVLQDYPGCVIDFGAGHSHYINKTYYFKVKSELLKYENVLLILPSPVKSKSIEIIRKRNLIFRNKTWVMDKYDFIYHWIEDFDNYDLAKKIIFTENKSIKETAIELINLLS